MSDENQFSEQDERRRRTWIIGGAVAAVVLLCCCCVGGYLAWTQGDVILDTFNLGAMLTLLS